MNKNYLIGVDLGTSAVKSTLFNLDGEAVADASRSMEIRQPQPGYAEQNPEDFVVAASDTIREIVEKSALDLSSVAAVAFDGQMAGATAIDRNWNPITPWYPSALDTRYLPYAIWLYAIGVKVTTLFAGIGIGGAAIAFAAQDSIKNFFGSVTVLADKPFFIGQRIVVGGNDGVVEEIGLRSTRIRLLTGHRVSVPNKHMAELMIENISERPHIRRLTNIRLALDTPPDKARKAIHIIEKVLEGHEGQKPDFPPRVYFNEFNEDSLNILVLYWYHPADYWSYNALNQRVNLAIMEEFEKEGIQLAPPTFAYMRKVSHQS